MPKRVILFIICAIFFSASHFAQAGLVIDEIMYDPEGADTDREWIEVYNDSDTAIDLSTYKFFEADTNHSLISAGDDNLPAKGYALIVADYSAFKADWPGNSSTVYDSSFSLSNTGEELALKDDSLNIIDRYTYNSDSGGGGDGASLQLVDGTWSGSVPTPGGANQVSPVSLVENDDNSGDDSVGSVNSPSDSSKSSASKKVNTSGNKIKAIITIPKIAFIGTPFEIEGVAFNNNVRIRYGRYFWNFGDGNSKEDKNAEHFPYQYSYEGDYVISLDYYMKRSSKTPDATAKIAVKVVPASVIISKVGTREDFFIELFNNTNYEMDISGWMLASLNETFTMPRNSNILSKKKIILSPKITNFTVLDKDTLKLITSQNSIAFDYGASIIREQALSILSPLPPSGSSFILKTSQNDAAVTTSAENKPARVENENFPNLSSALQIGATTSEGVGESAESSGAIPNSQGEASAIESDVLQNNYKNSYLFMLISIIFIISSAGAVYFIRQKKLISANLNKGDDFKILNDK